MTKQEFEQLRRRFGADVSLWPAPYRQEAARFLAGTEPMPDETSRDEALERLILRASDVTHGEGALTRNVLARINGQRQSSRVSLLQLWQMPVAASGFAALLMLAAIGGYMVANEQSEAMDDSLLALAIGGHISEEGALDGLEEGEQL